MTKQEYMSRLQKSLRRLPKDSFDEAMEYFEEYFAEAEDEQAAIENLGSPEEAAAQIIADLAWENAEEPEKSEGMKKSLSAIWIGILAVFAAPIGLPLAFAAVVVIMAFLIVIASLWLTVALVSVCFVVCGAATIVGSIVLAFTSFANGLITLGAALVLVGLGILLGFAAVYMGRWLLHILLKSFAHFARGGKQHE